MRIAMTLLLALMGTVITLLALLSLYQTKKIYKWKGRSEEVSKVKTSKVWSGFQRTNVYKWHLERLEKSGEKEGDAHVRASLWLSCVIMVGFMAQVAMPFGLFSGVFAVMAMFLCFAGVTEQRIRAREISFATGVYKIYRYLALQITAGLKVTDTLKHLHEASNQPFLKEAMYAYSTRYFQTMDLDRATEELTKRISGQDVQILTAILKQGITTGDHYQMLKKQEKLMIRRYYAALEAETERMRRRGIIIAISLCLLVFLILALPMVYEMSRATRSIFSY